MSAADAAAVVSAVAACITAVGGVIVTLFIFIPSLRTARRTHEIVNQQRTDLVNYSRALTRTLREHGIDVPVDQSLPPDGDG